MMTAEQLKESILQLAMQGKLVEQRSEEGTGEELYKEIQVERKRLIKEGKIKKQKPLPEITEDEIPFEIPESWEWVRVGRVFNLQAGKNKTSSEIGEVQTDILQYPCYGGNGKRGYVKDYNRDGVYALIGRQGALCGNINIASGKFYATEHAVVVEHFCSIDVRWSGYFLRALNLNQYATATAQPGLSVANINRVLIPIPPIAEQKRIVAKIEDLMPLVEQYAAASTKLNTLNASFPEMMKKSILQEAVQGKLVPQDPNDEPASLLLKKIAEEKKRLIKEGKIKKDKNTSRIVREGNSWFEFADGQKTCIDEEIPFEIPDNWSWVRLNELGDYKKGPFGSALTKSMFVPAGPNSIKVYEQKNAIQKDWTLGEYYIRKEYYEEKMSGFTVEGGDVIVSCAGTIGETYVMPDDIELGIINQALMRMKVYEPMNVDYFLMYFDYVIKATAREQSKGSAIKNIPPFAVFKRILFPMPPLSEQNRILSRLTEILLEVDKLE